MDLSSRWPSALRPRQVTCPPKPTAQHATCRPNQPPSRRGAPLVLGPCDAEGAPLFCLNLVVPARQQCCWGEWQQGARQQCGGERSKAGETEGRVGPGQFHSNPTTKPACCCERTYALARALTAAAACPASMPPRRVNNRHPHSRPNRAPLNGSAHGSPGLHVAVCQPVDVGKLGGVVSMGGGRGTAPGWLPKNRGHTQSCATAPQPHSEKTNFPRRAL